MSEIDKDNFRIKLNNLMVENKVTQTMLSEIISMSQSNISKALQLGNKKFFTINHIFLIAEYFNVSIDEMLGRNKSLNNSTEKLARLIVHKVENHEAIFKDIELEDHYYNGDLYAPIEYEKELYSYPSIIFRNKIDYLSYDQLSEDEIDDLQTNAYMGNDELVHNRALNDFIKKFRHLYHLYTHNQLEQEEYQALLNNSFKKLHDLDIKTAN